MKPPVVVLGATGQVGLFAISRLLEQERTVIAVTRTAANTPDTGIGGLRRVESSRLGEVLTTPEDILSGKPALLSCGPVRLALELLQSKRPGVVGYWERVVITGTTSTLSKKASSDEAERNMIEEIETACVGIREVCSSGQVPLTILSPTLIYGCGMDQNLSRVYRWIQRFGFAPVASVANGLRQPLHVRDLARTIVSALQVDPAPLMESPVCGQGTLPYNQMIGRLFDAAGRKRRFLRLHGVSIPLVVGLSRLVPGSSGLNSEMFRRQSNDLVFDDSPAREQLGHNPGEFHPTDTDFMLPPEVERIRQALT